MWPQGREANLRAEHENVFVTWGRVMKSSNLAVCLELEEDSGGGAAERIAVEAAALERRAARRRARLRKSIDYRAIVIRDPGLRLFRVR
jgi:hypothetical protein